MKVNVIKAPYNMPPSIEAIDVDAEKEVFRVISDYMKFDWEYSYCLDEKNGILVSYEDGCPEKYESVTNEAEYSKITGREAFGDYCIYKIDTSDGTVADTSVLASKLIDVCEDDMKYLQML